MTCRKALKSQVACYLSFNIITMTDRPFDELKTPRFDSIPLITFANLLLALHFYLLAFLPPDRRRQFQVAWLVAGIVTVVAAELWRDLLKTYVGKQVLNVC